MLGLEKLEQQSRKLNLKMNEFLKQQEILHSTEIMTKLKKDHNREAQIKKLREKLNLVVCSRNRANESNKRLIADFDRVHRHLAMMESTTVILLDKVNSQKQFLDQHYPNWREKANMFVAPSYISQENIFNLLDLLRCRLSKDVDISFRKSTAKMEFNSSENLVSILDSKYDPPKWPVQSTGQSPALQKEVLAPISEQTSGVEKSDNTPSTPRKLATPRDDPIAKTLPQITESGDVSLKFGEDVETEDTISPRPTPASTLFYRQLSDFNESDSSEGGVEDILSPQKIASVKETSWDRSPSADSRASVDTVIKNPITLPEPSPTILVTLTSQMNADTETATESTVPVYTPAPQKRKTALELLNESSESETAPGVVQDESLDSEDDFDFFD